MVVIDIPGKRGHVNGMAAPEHSDHHVRQFSLRQLFLVMLSVGILMMASILARDSRYFSGLYSVWTLVSIGLIAAVSAVNQLCLIAPRMLALGSLLLYRLSMCVPVTEDGKGGVNLGWEFAWFTLQSSTSIIDWLGSDWQLFYSAAMSILVGCLANLLFLLGYIVMLCSFPWRWTRPIARWSAWLGFLSAIAALPLSEYVFTVYGAMSTPPEPPPTFYPGYGLWVASLFALALGSSANKTPELNAQY